MVDGRRLQSHRTARASARSMYLQLLPTRRGLLFRQWATPSQRALLLLLRSNQVGFDHLEVGLDLTDQDTI